MLSRALIFLIILFYVNLSISLDLQGFNKVLRNESQASIQIVDKNQLNFIRFESHEFKFPHLGARDLKLDVIVDTGSSWSFNIQGQKRIKDEIEQTQQILNQCGIQLSQVNVLYAKFQRSLLKQFDSRRNEIHSEPGEALLARSIRSPVKPLLILAEKVGTRAYNQSSVQRLSRWIPTMSWAENVTTVSWADAKDYESRFKTRPSYSIVAHELTHILGDLYHVSTPEDNLMNSYGRSLKEAGQAKSGRLFDWQCQEMMKFKFL